MELNWELGGKSYFLDRSNLRRLTHSQAVMVDDANQVQKGTVGYKTLVYSQSWAELSVKIK